MNGTIWRRLATSIACASALVVSPMSVAWAQGGDTVRGLYLLRITGCNDCHTAGYAESGGRLPTQEWLKGSPVGFHGPWGTTYASNLRLMFAGLTEREWLQRARQPMRPPMPWFALRDMSDKDLRAIYAAIRSLGPSGAPAPAFVPPERQPSGLVIEFVPRPAAR